MKYDYFITYFTNKNDIGSCSIGTNKKIKSWKDIEKIQNGLQEFKKCKNVIIINFQLLNKKRWIK